MCAVHVLSLGYLSCHDNGSLINIWEMPSDVIDNGYILFMFCNEPESVPCREAEIFNLIVKPQFHSTCIGANVEWLHCNHEKQF